ERSVMKKKRVTVTGGAGFLGQYVVEAFCGRGYDVFVPRHADYDLTREEDVCRMYDDGRPDIVIHLAAVVGGLGANVANPAKFLYENLLVGVCRIEHARRLGVAKFVTVGCIGGYPKITPVAFRGEAVNLGPGRELSMRELITTISELVGFTGDIVWDTTMPNGQPRRRLDTRRAADRFGFRATTEFRDGLARTIDWYRRSK